MLGVSEWQELRIQQVCLCVSECLSLWLCVPEYTCLSVSVSVYLSVYVPVHLGISVSLCLSVAVYL